MQVNLLPVSFLLASAIVTSSWARWCLKSPASRYFAQPCVQVQIKENIKASRQWPLWGKSTGHSQRASNTLFTRGLWPLCPLVRLQNWPGCICRSRVWYTGRSDIAMVTVKFWACSKQSHKGRRRCRSLTGRSKEAGGRHTHRRGRRMDAQWSAIGRPVKNAYWFENRVSIWAMLLHSLYHHCASLGRPITSIERSLWRPQRLHSVNHGNPWATLAMVLPPFCLLCATCIATTAVVQGRHWGRAAAVRQKHNFLGLGDHWAS